MMSVTELAKIDELNLKAWDLMVNDPEKGVAYAKDAFASAEVNKYQKGIADSLLNEGWYHIYKSENLSAFDLLTRGLEIYVKLNNFYGRVRTLNALGVVYHSTNHYYKALEYYSECLQISREHNINNYIFTSLGNTGEIFLELGRYREALDLFKQEEKLLESGGNNEEISSNLLSLGNVYGKLGDNEKALLYLSKAGKIASDIENKVVEASCLIQLGIINRKLKKYEKAENSFLKGLKISRDIDLKKAELKCLTNFGYLYKKQKNYKKALSYHDQALSLSKKINSKIYEYKNYLAFSRIYEEEGEYKKAFENYKNYYSIKNKIIDEDTEKKLKSFTEFSELDKKEKEAEIYRLRNVELKEAYNNISVISRIGQDITKSLDMETIMMTVSDNVKNLMRADFFGIALYDRNREEIDFKYYIEGKNRVPDMSISIDSERSLAAWCIKNKSYILINDLNKESENYVKGSVFILYGTQKIPDSLIYIPLKVKDEICGVLTVQSYASGSYTEKHVEILNTLASYISIALENSFIHSEINKLNNLLEDEKKELEEAYEQISVMANHDNLTGLPNRKLLTELISKDIKRAARNKRKIGILFIDLDGFKTVNDTLGHDTGDKTLKLVAEKLQSIIRASDTVARIGGDEFLISVPGLKRSEEAGEISKKIISGLSSINPVNSNCCRIGASIGISIYPDDDTAVDGLISKADTAMYYVKRREKNSYQFHNLIS